MFVTVYLVSSKPGSGFPKNSTVKLKMHYFAEKFQPFLDF